jgi:hypothetical protein
MDSIARDQLERIREAVLADRVEITTHFEQRLGERGLIWADLLTLLDQPTRMEDQGPDAHGWPKWRIGGQAADGTRAAVVVAVRDDSRIRFITIHWEE